MNPLTESIDFSNIIPDLESRLLRIENIKESIWDKNNLNKEASEKRYLLEIRLLAKQLQYLGIQIPGETHEEVRKKLRRLIAARCITHERVFGAVLKDGRMYLYDEAGRSIELLSKKVESTTRNILETLISAQEHFPILGKKKKK